MFNFKLI